MFCDASLQQHSRLCQPQPQLAYGRHAEWQAEAKERELEAVALRHIKAEAKAAERSARAEVDVDAVRQEQRSGIARVQETMGEIVSTLPRGVKRDVAPDAPPQAHSHVWALRAVCWPALSQPLPGPPVRWESSK